MPALEMSMSRWDSLFRRCVEIKDILALEVRSQANLSAVSQLRLSSRMTLDNEAIKGSSSTRENTDTSGNVSIEVA